MNIGVYICLLLAVFFSIIGILFAIFKGRAAGYVSGFNYFSREEQEKYDNYEEEIDDLREEYDTIQNAIDYLMDYAE